MLDDDKREDVKSVCANNAIFGFSVKCFIAVCMQQYM